MTSHHSDRPLLVLASTYPAHNGDGTPSFVRDLAVGLADRFAPHLLVPAVPGGPSEEAADGITVSRYRYFPRRWEDVAHGAILENVRSRKSRLIQLPFLVAAQWRGVRRELRHRRPDVIHAHWIIPQGLVARVAAPRIPLMVTTLGGDLYALNDPISRALKRSVLRHASVVTVMSADMRSRAIALGADPATTHVLPMGAQVAQFADAAAGRADRTADGSVRLLAVGRLVEKKGFHLLLQSLADVGGEGWHLTIVGDGPQRATLERAAAGLPVTFAGQLTREQLTRADAEADIAVFPSVRAASGDQDGLPVALLEAMASGCAVVVSDLPGLAESVEPGVSGLVVPTGDAGALTEALARLIGDRDATVAMGLAAADRALRFDVSAVADAYAALLEEAASRRASAEEG
ncbi:glycosyltransferase [Demequina sp. TTPB684]|uniref:glycosyltransferase n=1 Tax=unclassified Demequina TaxID=2620311 RepID=UPI001CF3AD1E|nr:MULTISPECIES: glycosyltransferase [unclassified Demequina]MCB2412729.1 glycosyltransferase [Demequina sp. TTPB684]UPU87851.1 glycosyltransferase [Demequina sp. TMPB413]